MQPDGRSRLAAFLCALSVCIHLVVSESIEPGVCAANLRPTTLGSSAVRVISLLQRRGNIATESLNEISDIRPRKQHTVTITVPESHVEKHDQLHKSKVIKSLHSVAKPAQGHGALRPNMTKAAVSHPLSDIESSTASERASSQGQMHSSVESRTESHPTARSKHGVHEKASRPLHRETRLRAQTSERSQSHSHGQMHDSSHQVEGRRRRRMHHTRANDAQRSSHPTRETSLRRKSKPGSGQVRAFHVVQSEKANTERHSGRNKEANADRHGGGKKDANTDQGGRKHIGITKSGKKKDKMKGKNKDVRLDTRSKSNQAFYNILLGIGAVIIMILFCKVSSKDSNVAAGNDTKQDAQTDLTESREKDQSDTGLRLDLPNPQMRDVGPGDSSFGGKDHQLLPDAPAKGSLRGDCNAGFGNSIISLDGPKLGLEARPEIGQHYVRQTAPNESNIEDSDKFKKSIAKGKIDESSQLQQEIHQEQNENIDVDVLADPPSDVADGFNQTETESSTTAESGLSPETRDDAFNELKELKAKEKARKKLEDERNEAIEKLAKLEEDQAKVLEQEDAAEKAFKRFPYKARKAAVGKIGEKHWENSSWRARVNAAQEAMQEEEPSKDNAKGSRKKVGRTEKRGKDS